MFSNSGKPSEEQIEFEGEVLEQVTEFKYLGIWFTSNLSFKKAYEQAIIKMERAIGIVTSIFKDPEQLPLQCIRILYSNCILAQFLYGTELWGLLIKRKDPPLENRYLKRMLRLPKATSHELLSYEIPLNPISNAREISSIRYILKKAMYEEGNELASEAVWFHSVLKKSKFNLKHLLEDHMEKLECKWLMEGKVNFPGTMKIIKARNLQWHRKQQVGNGTRTSTPYTTDAREKFAADYFDALPRDTSLTMLRLRTNSTLKPNQYKWGGGEMPWLLLRNRGRLLVEDNPCTVQLRVYLRFTGRQPF